jgi:predicted patatin/cPLA2 family phospholipase
VKFDVLNFYYKYGSFKFKLEKKNMSEDKHNLRLTVDMLSVKDMRMSANLMLKYVINLGGQSHAFQSFEPTPVNSSNQEKQLKKTLASYEFAATKNQLHGMLAGNCVTVNVTN